MSWSGDDLQDDPEQCTSALTGDPNTYAGGDGRTTVWQNDDYKGDDSGDDNEVRRISYMMLNSSTPCIYLFAFDPG